MKERIQTPRESGEFAIQEMAAWVLRTGVIASVMLMLAGLVLSCVHGLPDVSTMKRISYSDDLYQICHGLAHADGRSTIDAGILLLVLTPIIRVALSMVLFLFVDRDHFYAFVTFIVLVLTVSSLVFLRHI